MGIVATAPDGRDSSLIRLLEHAGDRGAQSRQMLLRDVPDQQRLDPMIFVPQHVRDRRDLLPGNLRILGLAFIRNAAARA